MNRERSNQFDLRKLLMWTAVGAVLLGILLVTDGAYWAYVLAPVYWIATVVGVRAAAGTKAAGIASLAIATATGLVVACWYE